MVAYSCVWIRWFGWCSPQSLVYWPPLCLCNHFICNTAACLPSPSACKIECNLRWSFWMLMCLQSMPSFQPIMTSVHFSVCEYNDSGYFLLSCRASFCFEKNNNNKTFTVTDFDTCLPQIDISGNDAGGLRWEWYGNSLLQSLCIHCQCQSHSTAAILWWVCVTTSLNKLKLFQRFYFFGLYLNDMIHVCSNSENMCLLCLFIITESTLWGWSLWSVKLILNLYCLISHLKKCSYIFRRIILIH